jgi:hypothetical protein
MLTAADEIVAGQRPLQTPTTARHSQETTLASYTLQM